LPCRPRRIARRPRLNLLSSASPSRQRASATSSSVLIFRHRRWSARMPGEPVGRNEQNAPDAPRRQRPGAAAPAGGPWRSPRAAGNTGSHVGPMNSRAVRRRFVPRPTHPSSVSAASSVPRVANNRTLKCLMTVSVNPVRVRRLSVPPPRPEGGQVAGWILPRRSRAIAETISASADLPRRRVRRARPSSRPCRLLLRPGRSHPVPALPA